MAELLNKKKYEVEYDNLIDPTKFPTIYRTIEVSSVTAVRGQAITFKAASDDDDPAYAVAASGDAIVAIAANPIAETDTVADVYVAGAFVAANVLVGTAAPTEADKVAAQGNGIYLI